MYSVQHDRVDKIVIHANDKDIIVICVFYAATLLKDLSELWVRMSQDNYLPIHEISAAYIVLIYAVIVFDICEINNCFNCMMLAFMLGTSVFVL